MNKFTVPQGIRQLAKWHGKGTLKFDLPIQRASGQWSLISKSLLIHSILADYPIPALYFVKYKDKETYYQALDGKQRCTSIFEFINGGYALHGSTPSVVIDDTEYELANKTFGELSEECRDLILGYRFTIYAIENATDEEIEEAFARLNASVPLTLIQKARTEMGTELAEWTREITKLSFFQHAIPFTLAQARRESELEVLLQSMLLMDAKDEGYEYTAISMSGVMKYCHAIRGNYGEGRRTMIRCITDYLTEAFPELHKFLKKSNVPMVFVTADLAMQNDIDPSAFKLFIDSFAGSVCPAYEENMGSGNIKRVKTEGRLIAMFQELVKYFGLPADTAGTPIYVKEADSPKQSATGAGKSDKREEEAQPGDTAISAKEAEISKQSATGAGKPDMEETEAQPGDTAISAKAAENMISSAASAGKGKTGNKKKDVTSGGKKASASTKDSKGTSDKEEPPVSTKDSPVGNGGI